MTWGKKAAEAAIEYAKLTMRPVQTLSDHMADAFHAGARWQREALLSDESVERAAQSLFYGDIDPDLDVTWATAHEGVRAEYLEVARAALTAAIGGDDE